MCRVVFSIYLSLILVTVPSINHHLHEAFSQSQLYIDNSGVPGIEYGCVGGYYVGNQRNPVTVSHHGLSTFAKLNGTQDQETLERFLNISDWLVANAVPKGNYSLLTYSFYWPTYDIQAPWQSGMAQARALEVLGKAYELTSNQTYLDTAKSLLNSFFVEVKDGGVTYKTPNEGWWYEDFADNGANPTRALDGMMSAILSINRYFENTNDLHAKFLFDQGVIALKNNLPLYDNNGYSYFDILKRPSPPQYHAYQVGLLGRLLDIVGEDEILRKYHDKWNKTIASE